MHEISKRNHRTQVKDIDNYAFNSCYSLTEITIPENVTNIGNDAFNYCKTIYGYSGSAAQTYADEYSINFVSIGNVTPTTTQPAVITPAETTVTTTVTTVNKTIVSSEVSYYYKTDYPVSSIKVEANNQNYDYNDEEFKIDGVIIEATVIEMANRLVTTTYYWSDGSTETNSRTEFGPSYKNTEYYSLADLKHEFDYISPAEVYRAFVPIWMKI